MTAPPRKRGRPPSGGETPRRSIRVNDETWNEIRRLAQEEGVTATEYIIQKTVGASR